MKAPVSLSKQARNAAIGFSMAAIALASFAATAMAASTVSFYPPMGSWASHGYPDGTVLCMAWNHSIVTQATRLSDGPLSLYVSYYDVYGGSSTPGGMTWRNVWVADGWDYTNSYYNSAPLLWAFSSDFTSWPGKWFNSDPTHRPYGETRFGSPVSNLCQGTSVGWYRP